MEIKTDFLVIGSGIAGLMFAHKVSAVGSVALVTKRAIMDSNTALAQGGIASVMSEVDSFEAHINDTLASGDGLCRSDVVEMVVKQGPGRIQELIDLGVQFNLDESRRKGDETVNLALGREGGHSQKRIVHAQDMTGRELETVMVDHVRNQPNIHLYENHITIDLITHATRVRRGLVSTATDEYCCGAYVLDLETSQVRTFSAAIVLLATGGAGKVYLYTSNPDIATGDGIAMAYRAGATVANLEFVQFHPTCLYHPDAKNFLISEAVRGEGAVLVDRAGKPFMHKYHSDKDLACRDVVARAIDTELKKSGEDSVFLNISHQDPEFIRQRFPNIYSKCLSYGMDITRDPIPVVPAAHYMCGGVTTDINGRTDIDRLYAIGETACTGLHGANRLASNSLIEALVYAHKAAGQAIKALKTIDRGQVPALPAWDEVGTTDSDEVIMVAHNWDEIRRLMWNYVGIVRSDKRLARAKRRIEMIQKEINEYYWGFKVTAGLIELRNIATVAELIVKSALSRKESRGLHYNIEYPDKDERLAQTDTRFKRPLAD